MRQNKNIHIILFIPVVWFLTIEWLFLVPVHQWTFEHSHQGKLSHGDWFEDLHKTCPVCDFFFNQFWKNNVVLQIKSGINILLSVSIEFIPQDYLKPISHRFLRGPPKEDYYRENAYLIYL